MIARVARSAAGLIFPLLALALWEAFGDLGLLPDYLPPPSAIGGALWKIAASGELFTQSGVSLLRALAGFGVGATAGVIAGLCAGSVRAVRELLEPPILALNPVPKIAFLPVFTMTLGLGHESKIAIIAFSAFFPAFLASLDGLLAVPRRLVWSARSMGAGAARLFFRVSFPAALPSILSGLRIGLALSFIVLFAAELMGGDNGLGYVITLAGSGAQFDLMLAATAVIAFLGFFSDRALLRARAALLKGRGWQKEAP